LAIIDAYGISVIAFMGLVLSVGILTSFLVKKSSKRYMVAGKSLPLFFVGTMLTAQAVDGNSSLGNVALVYQFGFWAGAAIPIGLATCLILTATIYGPRLNKMSMLTLPDFYFRRYGVGTEGISSVIMMVSFIILVAGNFAAGGFILSTVLHIPLFWGMLIVSSAVLIYTFAGGLFSSAYTDIFQVYLTIGAFWATFLFFVLGFGGIDFSTILEAAPEGFVDLSGLTNTENGALVNWGGILALGIGDVVALDFMERVFSARDPKTARRGALMSAGLTISVIVPVSMMGIVALYFLPNIADPYTVYPTLAIEHLPFPIGAALLMGVLGASMSTANGGLLAISSVIARNLIQRDILRSLLKKSFVVLGDFTGNLAVPPSLPRSAGFWGDGPASSSVGSSVRRIWAIGRSSLTHGGFVRVLVKFFNGAVGFGRSMICAFLRAITGWGMLAFRVDLGNRFTDRHGWTSCSVPVRPCGRPSLARSALLQAGVTGARAQRNKHSFPS
jgi:Na+/proline symporter